MPQGQSTKAPNETKMNHSHLTCSLTLEHSQALALGNAPISQFCIPIMPALRSFSHSNHSSGTLKHSLKHFSNTLSNTLGSPCPLSQIRCGPSKGAFATESLSCFSEVGPYFSEVAFLLFRSWVSASQRFGFLLLRSWVFVFCAILSHPWNF